MPNRMLRDWTRSDRVNSLSVQAERFFVRLIMKVDDYGCYYADPRILKADLFPLLENVRNTDIPRWLAECQKSGLIAMYDYEGKRYLQIRDFRQRLDKAKSKFPLPTNQPVNDFREVVNDFPAEVEVEYEVEKEKEKREAFRPPTLDDVIEFMCEKLDDFTAQAEASKFISFYESKGWIVGKVKMKNWKAAAAGWISRMRDYGSKPKYTMEQLRQMAEEQSKNSTA